MFITFLVLVSGNAVMFWWLHPPSPNKAKKRKCAAKCLQSFPNIYLSVWFYQLCLYFWWESLTEFCLVKETTTWVVIILKVYVSYIFGWASSQMKNNVMHTSSTKKNNDCKPRIMNFVIFIKFTDQTCETTHSMEIVTICDNILEQK